MVGRGQTQGIPLIRAIQVKNPPLVPDLRQTRGDSLKKIVDPKKISACVGPKPSFLSVSEHLTPTFFRPSADVFKESSIVSDLGLTRRILNLNTPDSPPQAEIF